MSVDEGCEESFDLILRLYGDLWYFLFFTCELIFAANLRGSGWQWVLMYDLLTLSLLFSSLSSVKCFSLRMSFLDGCFGLSFSGGDLFFWLVLMELELP